MSGTQLIPAEPADENAIVQRFIDASREIVPSVQVTLAKRIVRPGSNRVMCLAAKTSAPLDDSEVASVSDLALKLSDGTNVVLSLSFFNDSSIPAMDYSPPLTYAPAAPYSSPVSHYVYEPNKYDQDNDGKFAGVVIAVVLGALAGLYVAGAGPFAGGPYSLQRLMNSHKPAAVQRHKPIKAPVKATAPAAIKPVAHPVPIAPQKVVAKAAPVHNNAGKRKAFKLRLPKITELRPAQMLIPPPPPITYSLPFPPPEYGQSFMTPPAKTSVHKPDKSKPEAEHQPALPKAKVSPPKPEPESTPPISSPAKAVPVAPVPGSDWPQLERLQIPGQ